MQWTGVFKRASLLLWRSQALELFASKNGRRVTFLLLLSHVALPELSNNGDDRLESSVATFESPIIHYDAVLK